jgi:ATP-dependent DNA helicase RecG
VKISRFGKDASDRIEITSYGGLPEELSEEEFFEGFSVLRNKEIMHIFKDLNLAEQLGSGVPRILRSYDKTCSQFRRTFYACVFRPLKQSPRRLNHP